MHEIDKVVVATPTIRLANGSQNGNFPVSNDVITRLRKAGFHSVNYDHSGRPDLTGARKIGVALTRMFDWWTSVGKIRSSCSGLPMGCHHHQYGLGGNLWWISSISWVKNSSELRIFQNWLVRRQTLRRFRVAGPEKYRANMTMSRSFSFRQKDCQQAKTHNN